MPRKINDGFALAVCLTLFGIGLRFGSEALTRRFNLNRGVISTGEAVRLFWGPETAIAQISLLILFFAGCLFLICFHLWASHES